MVPFIGAGISLISGAVSNLFTGEGRERRQARRLERRQKRAARQAGRITVKTPAARAPYYPPTKVQPTQADIKAPRKPVGAWLQENWYFVAGGAAVLLLVVWFTTKKKKVGNPTGRPKGSTNKSGSGSGSQSASKPKSKSNPKSGQTAAQKRFSINSRKVAKLMKQGMSKQKAWNSIK